MISPSSTCLASSSRLISTKTSWDFRPLVEVYTVFVTGPYLGQPFTNRQHFMERLCKKAGVREFGFHAIRHLTASILYREGQPVAVIQSILANDKLQRLSDYDGLTGIANRRKFDSVLETEWNRAMRSGASLTLAMIDVDHFKAYNDHLGHMLGDDCLRRVAQALVASIRQPSDLASRYGGEEFAVILPELTAGNALRVSEKLCSAVMELAMPHGKSPTAEVVTVSVGVATCIPARGGRPEALIREADANLYRAKEQGRNRVVAS